ncbi:hypothetical protein CDV31_011819 [Fusarium ambrosium]|uniref:Uncharacterized protein n=1 Tax=Fusarium ambrosium TaxID=131363 RepID=A0A428TED4_9HYPO|nr:hypothetical protein CDV31_011819 [Fusarium ambrosium]
MAHEGPPGSNGNTLQSVDPPEVYDEALPEVVQAPKITDESQSVPEQVGKDHIIPEVTEENVTPRRRVLTLTGVRRRTFYVIVAVVLVIAAAIGGGIGGALGSRNMSESNSDADGTSLSTFSTDSSSTFHHIHRSMYRGDGSSW